MSMISLDYAALPNVSFSGTPSCSSRLISNLRAERSTEYFEPVTMSMEALLVR